jgi:tetratricopeptide (TPR) repeat protein
MHEGSLVTGSPGTLAASPLVTEALRLSEAGNKERAAQLLIEHLRRHPDEPRGMVALGTVAMQLGALEQAAHFLRKGIARGQTGFDVKRNLVSVLAQQERLALVEPMVVALAAETGDPSLEALHANILERLGRSEEALALQKKQTELFPSKPHVWVAYGHGLRAAGKVDEAVAAYRKAIEVDPEFGEGWWGLAGIRGEVITDADIDAMHAALKIAVDLRNVAPIHFALARAYAGRKDYEQAFRHFEMANGLRAESVGYDPSELTNEVDEVVRTVDAAFINRLPDAREDKDQPVFIVSLPRSGSTLLEQMIGSHPMVEPIGELPYIPAILRSFMELATRRGKITVSQAIAAMTDEQAAAFGRDYLARAALHRKTDRPMFIDKLPQNWSNVLFIKRILPQARFLDIRRPAMDCCFSNFTQSFTSAHSSSFTLEHIGQCYVDYVRLMDHLDAVAPGLVHHVRYDALVDDPQSQLEPALEYLGLPWDDRVLRFHELDRVVRTPSSEQVRRPLNRDGMQIWAPYSRWLDPLRKALGNLAAC